MNKKNAYLFILIISIGIFFTATIREYHGWGDDFALYILHAKNISEGAKYGETGFIYNLRCHFRSPKTYPPVFPLLLSPVYKFFGLNFTAMKIEIIFFFLLFLFAVFKVFEDRLSRLNGLLLIALLGFNPWFWGFKDTIASDIPFLFFLYCAIYVVNKIYRQNLSGETGIKDIISVGALFYLSYGTRNIGLVLIPALFIYDLIIFKKIRSFPVKVTILFIFLVLLQTVFTGVDNSYYGIYREAYKFPLRIIRHNISHYSTLFSLFFINIHLKRFADFMFGAISIAAIIGYVINIRRRAAFSEIFFPLYTGVIMTYFCMSTRGLFPIVPLYMFYAFTGVGFIVSNLPKWARACLPALLILTVLFSYTGICAKTNWRFTGGVIGNKNALGLFNYVKKNTNKDDIFIFKKPRALVLFTGRRASYYPHSGDDIWDYVDKINAGYIITCRRGDPPYFTMFVKKNIGCLQKVYSNPAFTIHKIKGRPTPYPDPGEDGP